MASSSPLGWVITNGGPLIGLPAEIVDMWRGTDPPLGAVVPEGSTWGDGVVVCDYDRACDPPADAVTVGDSHSTWLVAVGARLALVLDGEVATTAIAAPGGIVLLRDASVDTVEDAEALLASVGEPAWHASPLSISLDDGRLSIFDAAYPGVDRGHADGGVLEAALLPGTYHLSFASPRDRMTLIRLTADPARPGSPAARVVIV
jgi:hypothetical protein